MKKTTITTDQVKHIAQLADLQLKPAEVKKFQKQLAAILDYVAATRKLNLQKIKPVSQVAGLKNIRKDQKGICLPRQAALANAAKQKNGYFVTRSVSEQWH